MNARVRLAYRLANAALALACGLTAVVVGLTTFVAEAAPWTIGDTPIGYVPGRSGLVALGVLGAGLNVVEVVGRFLARLVRERREAGR